MKNLTNKNIFLIGPMGAGKSSVGKYLAKTLNMEFYDTDEEIENRTGVDIGWIFDLEGEDGFRKRETAVIDEISQHNHIILATGGGSVLEETNRKILSERGLVIYLYVSLDYQHERTVNESRRPLLRVENREEVLERLYYERIHLYDSIADWKIPTDKRTIRAVSEDIIALLDE